MDAKEAKILLTKYSRPYRNAAEGFLVSATLFDMVDTKDAGILFDQVFAHAERMIGGEVDVAPAPQGWLRLVPKRSVGEVLTLE